MFFSYRDGSYHIHRHKMMVAKKRREEKLRRQRESRERERNIYAPRVGINTSPRRTPQVRTPSGSRTGSVRRRNYYPVHKFSEKELKDLRTCFEDADADGSGSIDKREMKKMLKKLGCYTTDKEFECLFREVDADGSGEIEFDEFLQGVRKLLSPPTDDDLVQKFKRLDQGNKGYLNFRDIKAGFAAMNHPISDRAINDMIAVASSDGDDQVSYEEFCAIAKRPRKI